MKLIHFYVYAILCCSKLVSSVPLCEESKKDLPPNVGHETQNKANSAFPTPTVPHVEVPVKNVVHTPNIPNQPILPKMPGSVLEHYNKTPTNSKKYLVVYPNGFVEYVSDIDSIIKNNPNYFMLNSQHFTNKATIPPHIANILENAYKLEKSKKATVPQMNIGNLPNNIPVKPAINVQTGIKQPQIITPQVPINKKQNIIPRTATVSSNIEINMNGQRANQNIASVVTTTLKTNINGGIVQKLMPEIKTEKSYLEKPTQHNVNKSVVNTPPKSTVKEIGLQKTVPKFEMVKPCIEKPKENYIVKKSVANTQSKPKEYIVQKPKLEIVQPCPEKPKVNYIAEKTVASTPSKLKKIVAEKPIPKHEIVKPYPEKPKVNYIPQKTVATTPSKPKKIVAEKPIPKHEIVKPYPEKPKVNYIAEKTVATTPSKPKKIVAEKPIPKHEIVKPCPEKQKVNYIPKKTVATTQSKPKKIVAVKPIPKHEIVKPYPEKRKVNYIAEKTVATTPSKPKKIVAEKPIPKHEIVKPCQEKPKVNYVVEKTVANTPSKPKEIIVEKPVPKVEIIEPCPGKTKMNYIAEKTVANTPLKPKQTVVQKPTPKVEIVQQCPQKPNMNIIADKKIVNTPSKPKEIIVQRTIPTGNIEEPYREKPKEKKNTTIQTKNKKVAPEKYRRSTEKEPIAQHTETDSFVSSSIPIEKSVEDVEETDFEPIYDDEEEIEETWHQEDKVIPKATVPEKNNDVIVVSSPVDEFFMEDIKPDDCHDDEEENDNVATDHIKIDKAFVFKTSDSQIADIMKKHRYDKRVPTYIFQLVLPVAVEREVTITIHPDGTRSEEVKETLWKDKE